MHGARPTQAVLVICAAWLTEGRNRGRAFSYSATLKDSNPEMSTMRQVP